MTTLTSCAPASSTCFETIKGKDVQFYEIQRLANQALAQTLGTGKGKAIVEFF